MAARSLRSQSRNAAGVTAMHVESTIGLGGIVIESQNAEHGGGQSLGHRRHEVTGTTAIVDLVLQLRADAFSA
jgi:hypothetical protein